MEKKDVGYFNFVYVAVFYIRFMHREERVQSPLAMLVASFCPV